MYQVILSRTAVPGLEPSFIIQRVTEEGNFEVLKETTHNTGEIVDPENELITVETITITRKIGEKIQF